MGKNDLTINPTQEFQEIVVREGAAEKIPDFRKTVVVTGTIGVPLEHLTWATNWLLGSNSMLQFARKIDPDGMENKSDAPLSFSYLQVDRDGMQIIFVEDAGAQWESRYTGNLMLNREFIKFGINNASVQYTPHELAELLKMKRTHFENKSVAMGLVSDLKKFEMKVEKHIEDHADERANKRVLKSQAVETNIPKNFKLKMPIFQGQEKVTFEVEISIDPTSLNCLLISPDANDYVIETRDDIFDEQIKEIKDLHSELRVFEV